MRQVQEALRDIGIPVIAGIWRATSENQNPPLQYVVYSSTTTDPTEMANAIRSAMYAYGFAMLEESDKGYNHPAYDPATRTYTVQWTWVWREEYGDGGDD